MNSLKILIITGAIFIVVNYTMLLITVKRLEDKVNHILEKIYEIKRYLENSKEEE